jgi:hypothetical protein
MSLCIRLRLPNAKTFYYLTAAQANGAYQYCTRIHSSYHVKSPRTTHCRVHPQSPQASESRMITRYGPLGSLANHHARRIYSRKYDCQKCISNIPRNFDQSQSLTVITSSLGGICLSRVVVQMNFLAFWTGWKGGRILSMGVLYCWRDRHLSRKESFFFILLNRSGASILLQINVKLNS